MSYVQEYIEAFESNNLNFLEYCKFAYNKYRMEHYSLMNRGEQISPEHYIIQGENREFLEQIINSGNCTKEQLTDFLGRCSEDDLSYIGI